MNAMRAAQPAALGARVAAAEAALKALPPWDLSGRVAGVMGLALEVEGLDAQLAVGDRLAVASRLHGIPRTVIAEVVGFRNGHAQALAFDALDGIGPGARVLLAIA